MCHCVSDIWFGLVSAPSRSMPFTIEELIPMCQMLRDTCLGIIELAHPDARFTIKDTYKKALEKTGVPSRAGEEHDKETNRWTYLFRVISSLVRQLHTRDTRRQFCAKGHWLAPHVQINAAKVRNRFLSR